MCLSIKEAVRSLLGASCVTGNECAEDRVRTCNKRPLPLGFDSGLWWFVFGGVSRIGAYQFPSIGWSLYALGISFSLFCFDRCFLLIFLSILPGCYFFFFQCVLQLYLHHLELCLKHRPPSKSLSCKLFFHQENTLSR